MAGAFGGVLAPDRLERLVHERVVSPGLDLAYLAQHGGGVAALGPREGADRQPGGGMGEIGNCAFRQPVEDHRCTAMLVLPDVDEAIDGWITSMTFMSKIRKTRPKVDS
jgi:hypothetical protein